jgi:hypothetical protein
VDVTERRQVPVRLGVLEHRVAEQQRGQGREAGHDQPDAEDRPRPDRARLPHGVDAAGDVAQADRGAGH